MTPISQASVGSLVEYSDKMEDGYRRIYRFKVLGVEAGRVKVNRVYSAHVKRALGKRPHFKFCFRHRITGYMHPMQPVTVLK